MRASAASYGLYVADRFTNTGTVAGGGGILFGGGGYFSNLGRVVGTTANGVHLIGGGTNVYNSGQILGAATGLYTQDDTTILNRGLIQGYHYNGIDARAGGTVISSGFVGGQLNGVVLGHGVVVNQSGGGIAGTVGAGVAISADGTITNDANGLIDGAVGVLVGTGHGNVYNSGYILGVTGTQYGYGVALGDAIGNVINFGSGYIYGARIGVIVTGNHGSSKVLNVGFINGRYGAGVYVDGTRSDDAVYINNYASGTITGHSGITGHGNVLVTNYGLINGKYGTGVDLSGGGFVDNVAGGVISGVVAGVSLYGTSGRVDNYGTITSANNGVVLGANLTVLNVGGQISGSGGAGVFLGAGGSVQNSPSAGQGGTIYGRYYGVLAAGTGTGSVTITNSGQIAGGFTGVDLRVAGQVVNNGGTIGGLRGSALILEGGGSVQNVVRAGQRGVINGAVDGVRGVGSSIQVSNSADIFGTQVGVELLAGGAVINQKGGRISGAVGVLVSGGNATVTDAGTISGLSYAVQFSGGGTDRLILDPGAVLSGKVSGAGAHSTLELAAGSSALSGLGTQFVGFEQVVVDRGANWTLSKANSLAAGSTLAVAGTLIVVGSLADSGAATIAGTLRSSGAGAVRIGQGASLTGGSVLAPGSTGSIEIGGAGRAARGLVTVDAGATLSGAGTVASAVSDSGSVRASGGTLRVAGSLVGSGFATIDSHSVLSVGGALGTARMVFLSGGGETAVLGSPTAVSAAISGFAATDTLDLVGFAATRLAFANDLLTVDRAAGGAAHLHFSSAYAGHHFAAASDGHGGTNISII